MFKNVGGEKSRENKFLLTCVATSLVKKKEMI